MEEPEYIWRELEDAERSPIRQKLRKFDFEPADHNNWEWKKKNPAYIIQMVVNVFSIWFSSLSPEAFQPPSDGLTLVSSHNNK